MLENFVVPATILIALTLIDYLAGILAAWALGL